jgi:hypothetical protein
MQKQTAETRSGGEVFSRRRLPRPFPVHPAHPVKQNATQQHPAARHVHIHPQKRTTVPVQPPKACGIISPREQPMYLEFDVFGKLMSVQRKDNEWLLFIKTGTGMRIRVYDVIIPPDLKENELANFLSDMYHEYGNENKPEVRKLD